jgi:molybdate transport system ATP-binding protein
LARYIEAHLKGVSLDRGGRAVLRDIAWRIRPDERWVLVGGNGAGKTQLLKLLAGDVWPTPTGSESRVYRWRGEWWRTPYEVKDEIAYVGAERQDKYEHYEWNYRVEQVVGTGLYRTDIPLNPLTKVDRQHIGALLERMSIAALARRRFLTLSYGERRLTLLARALAWRPKLLLLDELLNGLDDNYRSQVMRWLESTARSALPWVLATHRAEDVPKAATHAVILDEGRILYRGSIGRAPLSRWLIAKTGIRSKPPMRRPRGRLLVRFSNASVYLDGTRVLRDISFELRVGQCWVVHGPNGSGKSTLLRAIYGNHAVAGRIERAGIVPGVPLELFKKRVGWVAPQLQTDHPLALTAAEVVQSGRYASVGLNDPATAADRSAARRSLAFFGLAALAKRTLRELSYGQARRVLFARAWVRNPQLLLLDEPFAGVDAHTRRALSENIEVLIAKGVAVMLATHHRNEWPAGVTHELALRAGRAIYCGPVRQ